MKLTNNLFFQILSFVLLFSCNNNNTVKYEFRKDLTQPTKIEKESDNKSTEIKLYRLNLNKITYSHLGLQKIEVFDTTFKTYDRLNKWTTLGNLEYDEKNNISGFIEINKKEFIKFRNKYHNAIDTNSAYLIANKDSSFTFRTAIAQYTYNKEYDKNFGRREKFTWSEYNGYISDYKIYILGLWGTEAGERCLIDSTDNLIFFFNSCSEGPCSIPIFSPNRKLFITHSYSVSENYSIINIEKISIINGILNIKDYLYFSYAGMIEDLVWINDNEIAVEVSAFKDRKNNCYFKIKIQ